MLWMTERVTLTIDQVEAMGRADLARNLEALKQALRRIRAGKVLPACMDKMNDDKATQGSVDAARAQLTDLQAFIVEKNLVSIPGTEQAEVAESPPYKRWNFAYIKSPGRTSRACRRSTTSRRRIRRGPRGRQDDYCRARPGCCSPRVHEVWPGHFLQFLHANRSP